MIPRASSSFLILTDELQYFFLGQRLHALGLLLVQPIGETYPLVFTSLEAAILLDHGKPLLRCSLVLLDVLYGSLGIGEEGSTTETDILLLQVKSLTQRNYITIVVIGDWVGRQRRYCVM